MIDSLAQWIAIALIAFALFIIYKAIGEIFKRISKLERNGKN